MDVLYMALKRTIKEMPGAKPSRLPAYPSALKERGRVSCLNILESVISILRGCDRELMVTCTLKKQR